MEMLCLCPTFGQSSLWTDGLQRLKNAPGDRVTGVCIGFSPRTPMAEIIETGDAVNRISADCIVTFGAGSIADVAKLARFAVANNINTAEAFTSLSDKPRRDIVRPTIPIICIPTSLSGGEYKSLARATVSAIVVQKNLHSGAELDLSTGISAVDHCVETLCSLVSNETGDVWSRRGLKKLVSGLLDAKGVLINLNAIRARYTEWRPAGGSHTMGHRLGPLGVWHVDNVLHTFACCLRVQRTQRSQRGRPSDILSIVIRELGMPTSLEDVDMGSKRSETFTTSTLGDIWGQTNAVPLTEASQVLGI
ncbi:hypothetical protein EDB80DRAFT_750736 [Ilyonectria destructans]|nr:hypothetical protein EDB80DRAFT_750736 [Ilyonectria destructans]